jgi:hypothetical protein
MASPEMPRRRVVPDLTESRLGYPAWADMERVYARSGRAAVDRAPQEQRVPLDALSRLPGRAPTRRPS